MDYINNDYKQPSKDFQLKTTFNVTEYHDVDSKFMFNFDPDKNLFNSLYSFYPLVLPEKIPLCKINNIDLVNDDINNLFSIMHINSRSLLSSINDIVSLLNLCNNMFSVICIMETWLNESSATLVSLSELKFVFVYKNRIGKTGGGIGIFVRNNLKFITRQDLEYDSDYFESMVVEILNFNRKNYFIIVIYRPPNTDPFKFLNDLNGMLFKLKPYINKPIYILGDFNIDLIKNDYRNVGEHFSSVMYSFNFTSLIFSPTRFSNTTSSLIDNIFTNNHVAHASGTISSNISDHLPIFTRFEFGTFSTPIGKLFPTPNFAQKNLIKLNLHLQSIDWCCVSNISDVDIALNLFITIIQKAVDLYCPPLSSKKVRQRKQPWMTIGLLNSSKTKNKLYKKTLISKSSLDLTKYLKYKNLFSKLCKHSENKYYTEQFAVRKNNVKRTWDLLKSCMAIRKPQTPLSIVVDGVTITDDVSISNQFNNYFASSFQSTNSFGSDYLKFKSYLGPSVPNSFFMFDCTQLEITNVIKNISPLT